jgi:T-complex protein 1 subunit alpha
MDKEISTTELLSGGENYTGMAAVEKNTKAIMEVYNAIKSSFGPLGLDKMCVDTAGEVSITNDGATILQNMVVEDPAAKILVDLATQQDAEVGDGTTSVVLLAANLVEKGSRLIASGVHPSVIASGYSLAFRKCVQFIRESLAKDVSALGPTALGNVVRTSISSKVLKEEEGHFCGIVVDALKMIETTDVHKKTVYPIEDINVLRHPGASMKDSFLQQGYAMNCSLASSLMKKFIKKPRIFCLDCNLQKYKSPLTVSVVVDDPEKLEEIRRKEVDMAAEKIKSIASSGANVVLTTKGIDDLCTKLLLDAGVVAIRRCKREDLLVIAKATGTVVLSDIVDVNGETGITGLGSADSFEVRAVGDEECVFINGMRKKMASVILRGPNPQLLDEMARSLHDALCILRKTLESKMLVPGGGTAECSLSLVLEELASTVNSKEYVAIHRYAEALLAIPKILASNAGLDANETLASLISRQTRERSKGLHARFYGIDVVSGSVQDNFEAGIIEPSAVKLNSLRAATEAAISILRINEIIILPPDQRRN